MIAEQDIFTAIQQQEFVPYFQPLVDLRSGHAEGFEILARWLHPQLGLVPPSQFIEVIERNGWMNGLTVSILRKSFLAARDLPEQTGLSLNLSPLQLHDRTLPDFLCGIAHESGFDLRCLTLEVTESALFRDISLANEVATELKRRGVRLSLDDFGTGYSSLLHLQALPFDEIKVDGSFVSSMASNSQSRKITASVVSLGQSLGLRTVGEGVEQLTQAEMLMWQGCDVGQGWFYGRPMPAKYLASFMEHQLGPNVVVSALPAEVKGMALALEAHPTHRLPQLRAIYDGVPVGLAFFDRDLRYVNVNQRMAEMHGIPVEAHLGRKVSEVVPHKFAVVEPYLRRALAGEPIDGIRLAYDSALPGKQPIEVIVSYHPAFDEAGEVIGISAAALNVSVTLVGSASLSRKPRPRLLPRIPWLSESPETLPAANF